MNNNNKNFKLNTYCLEKLYLYIGILLVTFCSIWAFFYFKIWKMFGYNGKMLKMSILTLIILGIEIIIFFFNILMCYAKTLSQMEQIEQDFNLDENYINRLYRNAIKCGHLFISNEFIFIRDKYIIIIPLQDLTLIQPYILTSHTGIIYSESKQRVRYSSIKYYFINIETNYLEKKIKMTNKKQMERAIDTFKQLTKG